MKVYVLIEQGEDFDGYYSEILGVYKEKQKAINNKEILIQDNIKNNGFVEDENANENILPDNTIIFYDYQENWNNYIEYIIQAIEVR